MNKENEPLNPREAGDASDETENQVPTAGAAEDIGNGMGKKDSARLRRLADSLFWRAFTQDREK